MLLPLPQRWPIRCVHCGHRAEITANLTDLATKMLRCASCGHRQPFEPTTVVRSTKAGNGWRARTRRTGRKLESTTPFSSTSAPDLPPDRLDDLWAAG